MGLYVRKGPKEGGNDFYSTLVLRKYKGEWETIRTTTTRTSKTSKTMTRKSITTKVADKEGGGKINKGGGGVGSDDGLLSSIPDNSSKMECLGGNDNDDCNPVEEGK